MNDQQHSERKKQNMTSNEEEKGVCNSSDIITEEVDDSPPSSGKIFLKSPLFIRTSKVVVFLGAMGAFFANMEASRTFICKNGPDFVTSRIGCEAPKYGVYCTHIGNGEAARPGFTLIAENTKPDFVLSGAVFEIIEATPPAPVAGAPLLASGKEGVFHALIRPKDLRPGTTLQFNIEKPLSTDAATWALTFCPVLVGNTPIQSTVTFSPTFYKSPGTPLEGGPGPLHLKIKMVSIPAPGTTQSQMELVPMKPEEVSFPDLSRRATFSRHACEIVEVKQ